MADEELLAAPRSATVAKKDDTIKPYEVETTSDPAQANDEATSPASPVAPSVSVGVSSASPASAATAIASDDVPAAAHPTPDSASPTSHPVVSPPPNPSSPTPAQQQAPAPDASPVVDQLHAMCRQFLFHTQIPVVLKLSGSPYFGQGNHCRRVRRRTR